MKMPILFGALALLILSYSLITGPFRSPDEFNHFFRAYHVSEGKIMAKRAGTDLLGDYLPASLIATATIVAAFPEVPPVKTSRSELEAARQLSLLPDERRFSHFPNTALYSPLLYVPAAIGIASGRVFGLSPIALHYSARCFGALVAAGLVAYAIATLPQALKSLGLVALFPGFLFQTGMINPDAVSFGLIFVWVAVILRLRAEPDALSPIRFGSLVLLAICLSQLRPPYPLLAALIALIPSSRFPFRNRALGYVTVLFAAGLPCVIWNGCVAPLAVQMRPGVTIEPWQQLSLAFQEPIRFAIVVFAELWNNGFHWREVVGVFGWLQVPLPAWLVLMFTLAAAVAVSACDPPAVRLTSRVRAFLLVLVAIGTVAAELAIYMNWNALSAPHIEGFQGRYLQPLVVVLALASANGLLLKRRREVVGVATGVFVAGNCVALFLLWQVTWL